MENYYKNLGGFLNEKKSKINLEKNESKYSEYINSEKHGFNLNYINKEITSHYYRFFLNCGYNYIGCMKTKNEALIIPGVELFFDDGEIYVVKSVCHAYDDMPDGELWHDIIVEIAEYEI